MNELSNWLNMGGYAAYIWSSYGLVCLVFVLNMFGIRWQRKHTHKQLQRWFKSNEQPRRTSQS